MNTIKNEITVIGGYGGGNIGDDVLMLNVIKWLNLKYPKITPILIVHDKLLVEKLLVGMKVNVFDAYQDYDIESQVVIYGGGTQFFHFSKNEKTEWFDKMLKFAKNPLLIFKRLQKSFSKKNITAKHKILLGIGFGPFSSTESKEYLKFLNIVNESNYIFTRDNKSKNYIPAHYKDRVSEGIDICYNSLFFDDIKKYISLNSEKSNKIGIVIRDWKYDNIDNNNLINCLNELIVKNENIEFEFVFFCDQLDSKLVSSIVEKQNVKWWSWKPDTMELNSFFEKLSKYDLLLTSRFHGAIFAGLLDIPFITLEIEPKLSIPNSMYNNNSVLSPPFVYDDLNTLMKNIDINYNSTNDLNEELIKKGDEMFEELYKRINQGLINA